MDILSFLLIQILALSLLQDPISSLQAFFHFVSFQTHKPTYGSTLVPAFFQYLSNCYLTSYFFILVMSGYNSTIISYLNKSNLVDCNILLEYKVVVTFKNLILFS